MKGTVSILVLVALSLFICTCGDKDEPVANFTVYKTEIVKGESIQFFDLSTNTPSSWQWDFGDNTTSSQQNPMKTYNSSGTFTIMFTATNTCGSNTITVKNLMTVTDQGGGTGPLNYNWYNYDTVRISTQWWFAENLQTTCYNDGTAIPQVADNTAWGGLTTGAFCWYFNDATKNKNLFGALYNWYAVNTGKLCPAGWHVPTDADWKILEMALGMTKDEADGIFDRGTDQGTKMKTTSGWNDYCNGTNSSGFSGLPGGYRDGRGSFNGAGTNCHLWSSTERQTFSAWYRSLGYGRFGVYRQEGNKKAGFSVRCVRD